MTEKELLKGIRFFVKGVLKIGLFNKNGVLENLEAKVCPFECGNCKKWSKRLSCADECELNKGDYWLRCSKYYNSRTRSGNCRKFRLIPKMKSIICKIRIKKGK